MCAAAALTMAACSQTHAGSASDAGEKAATDAPAASGQAGSLVVDEATAKAITVDAVQERTQSRTLTVAGKVQFDDARVARVLAPVSGQALDVRAKVGDRVRKGDALFTINSREAGAALGELIEGHKDLDLAEKTATMTEDLFNHQAASRIALQQAQNDLAKAGARVARSEEALRVLGLSSEDDLSRFNGRLPIVSPLSGTVIERHVTEGQFVQPDSTPLVVAADLGVVWVLGDIFERDLHLVAVGDKASITAAAYPGERFQGRVEYVSDVIDPATRTAKVRVSVPNTGGRLKPEMFATISLGVAESERVVVVPTRATFVDAGRTWVYVCTAPGRFERRAVDVADAESGDQRVLGGLKPGDRVVVDGALLLRREEDKRIG